MLSKALQNAINDQVKNELFSAYLYLAMSAHFESAHLLGCARWMRMQSQEEASHAMKLLDVFQQALEHERKVSGMIHRLYELAVKENDFATQVMLQWFIGEQVEEERSAGDIVEQLKMVGDQPVGLFMLDQQLGGREAGGRGGAG